MLLILRVLTCLKTEQTYKETTEIYGKRACQLVKELASAEPGQLTRYNVSFFYTRTQ